MNITDRPAPSTSSGTLEQSVMHGFSVLHASTADHLSSESDDDFYLSELEVSPGAARHIILPVSQCNDAELPFDDFPASPILRTCLQQLSERHRSDSLNG